MNHFPSAVFLAAALLGSTGCATNPAPSTPLVSPREFGRPFEVGIASYYHDGLAGNRTANGEIYDPSRPSAAHKTLPLGAVIDVVRRDGRAVRVRVNDRGPFVAGRIVDLSRVAAGSLGMLREGIVEVAIYVVSLPKPRPRRR